MTELQMPVRAGPLRQSELPPGKLGAFLGLNQLRWYVRLPLKWCILAVTVVLVCFPYPRLLVRHLQRVRNPNQLIDPDARALEPLAEELRTWLSPDLAPREALNRIERYVYERVPFEWDWNTWGTADYLPTVEEVIAMGREDCDGRAVLAASLLRYFGFRADLVADFTHMWVRTDFGETMGPGRTKAFVATDKGLRMNLKALRELPRASAHSIAIFPLGRELIILGVIWLLLLPREGGVLPALSGAALFLAALGLLRVGSKDYFHPTLWMQAGGLISSVAGCAILMVGAWRKSFRPGKGRIRVNPVSLENRV